MVLLAASAVVGAAVVAGCAQDPAPPISGPAPPAGRAAPSPADVDHAVEDLLEQRAAAVATGDTAAWEATLVEGDAALLTRERRAFAGLLALPLEQWELRPLDLRAAADGGVRATVEVAYRLAGDDRPARVQVVLDLAPRDAELAVAGSSATPGPLWEVPGVASAEGDHSLVVGDLGREGLAGYAEQSDAAAEAVADLAPDGRPPHLSVVVLQEWDQARRVVGTGTAAEGLAAIATRLEAPGVDGGPVRVVVDPAVLSRLEPAARGAVLAHEAFHVAMQDLGTVPLWLSEGLADHAGYRASGIPLDRSISGFLTAVRDEGPPASLPADADFTPGPAATVAYEGAHLAVRMLVEEHGEPAVLRLYERVAGEGPEAVDSVLVDELGTDLDELTRAWQVEAESRARG